jgi:hypothetical protein
MGLIPYITTLNMDNHFYIVLNYLKYNKDYLVMKQMLRII